MNNKMDHAFSRKDLMRNIQIHQFSILETALYLDTHPHDKQALAYYNKINGRLQELVNTYQKEYGPLSIGGNASAEWQWTDGPWPWEAEGN